MLHRKLVDHGATLFPILLILAGVVALSLVFTAGLVGISSASGFGANKLSIALSGFALLIAGVVSASSGGQRRLSEWLLVAAGVVAIAVAADLWIVGAQAGAGFKQIMLASVVFAAMLTRAAPGSNEPILADWLSLSAFDWVKAKKFAGVAIQLGLLVLVIRQFELENQALYANIMPLVFYGFLVHYFLPARYRLSFFLLLSLAAILGIFGLLSGVYLVGLGLGLIAICHLPLPFGVRAGLLLGAGALLALFRAEWFVAPWPGAIWPVLGSMFMFRLIIYLYDLKHSKRAPDLLTGLSYFFLLPNIVFLLFPVVDYATFRRTYYNEDEHQIYQTGVKWMFWGVLHLLVYRYINYHLVISPQEVANVGDLVRYIVPNFLLLLRVSGQFHLIVGMLHLFGFNLPRAFHNYFVASSFTDFWRRANPYWKDFMVKICYYPAYFRLQKFGTIARLTLATIIVFIATWFFHAYQWFWLRGAFLFSGPDILFWSLFGIIILINSLYETRYGRKRVLSQRSLSARDLLSLSLRTIGTFTTVAILYSLWISRSVEEWLSLWSVLAVPLDGINSLIPLFLVIGTLVAGVLWVHLVDEANSKGVSRQPLFFKSAAINGLLILGLYLVGNANVYAQFGRQMPAPIADLTTSRLSDREAEILLQGYYENLFSINQFNSELWDIYSKRPSDWPLLQDTDAARLTNDFRTTELVPSTRINFHGALFTTNRWGMRDRDYDQIPPPGTYRVALLGPSFVMGSGVADDEVFEQQLEDRLNQENAGGGDTRYEILNFGMVGYSALQELWILDSTALSFEPDAVLLVAHQLEEEIVVRNLASRIRAGTEIPYDYLVEVAQQAGVTEGMSQVEAERRLTPFGPELLSWTYHQVVALSHERGALPIWVFMPILEAPLLEEEMIRLIDLAEAAGFVVLDLSDVYDNHDPGSLIVAEWDKHPNARAHTLIANRLYERLSEQKERIPLGIFDQTAAP